MNIARWMFAAYLTFGMGYGAVQIFGWRDVKDFLSVSRIVIGVLILGAFLWPIGVAEDLRMRRKRKAKTEKANGG